MVQIRGGANLTRRIRLRTVLQKTNEETDKSIAVAPFGTIHGPLAARIGRLPLTRAQ